jgi:hypothetical protein
VTWLVARIVTWSILGLLTALTLHYTLYRTTLPLRPFIYQAF